MLGGAKAASSARRFDVTDREPATPVRACPCCGGHMIIIETFARGSTPRHRPTAAVIRIDTS
jgi:hypothetical protein